MSESPARRAQLGPFGLYNDSPALSCGPATSTLLAGLRSGTKPRIAALTTAPARSHLAALSTRRARAVPRLSPASPMQSSHDR